MEYVDAALRRNIAPGTQYNKYFDKSECKVSYLGKGDTYHTLSKMKAWANKYSAHAKKLALGEFAGKSLEQIAREVHQFLYWHLQYKMDGADQQLKSPACAWATRAEGIDCKGYSIFASAILQNLGVKHYFRKIKQPAFEPELWSHVYLIVPKNQKTLAIKSPGDYYVIDPTVADNMEVAYTQTKEELMSNVSLRHYGLAGPRGLRGCSCTAKPTQVTNTNTGGFEYVPTYKPVALRAALPKSEQQLFNEAYGKFKGFLSALAAKGVPPALLQLAHIRLQESIRKGVEPTLRDLFSTKGQGLGVTGVELSLISNLFNQGGAGGGSTLTQAGSGVANTASMLTQSAGLISSIIPTEIFDKTFGAVFANGFNFKCWGATWNPTKAEKVLNDVIPPLKLKATQVLQRPKTEVQNALNAFWLDFYKVHSRDRDWLATSAKDCTKEGLKVFVGGLDQAAIEFRAAFKTAIEQNGGTIVQSGTKSTFYPDPMAKGHDLTYPVPQYKVTFTNSSPITTTAGRTTTTSTRTQSGSMSNSYVDANGNLVIPNTAPQEAGFGWVAAGLIAAVAIGAYAMKDSKSKN